MTESKSPSKSSIRISSIKSPNVGLGVIITLIMPIIRIIASMIKKMVILAGYMEFSIFSYIIESKCITYMGVIELFVVNVPFDKSSCVPHRPGKK